jgi:hypothetical protein
MKGAGQSLRRPARAHRHELPHHECQQAEGRDQGSNDADAASAFGRLPNPHAEAVQRMPAIASAAA